VEAGKVIAVEYPDAIDGDDGLIRLRLQLDKKFEERLFADASASIVNKGLLGTSYIAIAPGKPAAGLLASKTIYAKSQPDLAEVTAKLASVAGRVDNILKEIEQGEGTAAKLLRDDALYTDVKQLTSDTRRLIGNTDDAVTSLHADGRQTMASAQKALDGMNATLTAVQGEVAGLKDIVRTSKEAITAIKQDAEAVKSLPIVRNYVTDEVKMLVRPNCSKERLVYWPDHLFEPGKAILTAEGRKHIGDVAAWLRGRKDKGSDVVVATFADPQDKSETAASARELTKKRSEAAVNLLKEYGVAKMGTFTSRKVTPIGFGFEPTPVVEKEELYASRVEIILFVPK
jgi:hypothetical protein